MKVLSLKQPWASLVVTPHPKNNNRGIKEWETRCWRPRDPVLIERLKTEGFLIHASLGWKKEQSNLLTTWPFDQYEYDYAMDFGAIIGHVILVKIMHTSDWLKDIGSSYDEEYHFGDYGPDRFTFQLTSPQLFKEPIPCSGSLSFWNYDGPIPELLK